MGVGDIVAVQGCSVLCCTKCVFNGWRMWPSAWAVPVAAGYVCVWQPALRSEQLFGRVGLLWECILPLACAQPLHFFALACYLLPSIGWVLLVFLGGFRVHLGWLALLSGSLAFRASATRADLIVWVCLGLVRWYRQLRKLGAYGWCAPLLRLMCGDCCLHAAHAERGSHRALYVSARVR